MGETDTRRSYLEDNFAPVTEEITAFELAVVGELPSELNGRYVRNGPNPITPPDLATHHWFVGDGMVHGVCLNEGRVAWYRNRYVGSADVVAARGGHDVPGPNWNDSSNGPNTNVTGFAGTTWALVEAGACPVELAYDLETVARNDFNGTLPGPFTAHPKLDPETGELHAMTYALPEWLDHVQYVVVAADGKVRRTVDIPLPHTTMLHDMALTSRYAAVFDFPCRVDFDLALAEHRFPMRWQPGTGSRVGLLPREGQSDDIIWIDLPECYVFHPMNAYDAADGTAVIDVCVYPRIFDGAAGALDGDLARLERWTLNPTTATAHIETIDDTPQEFPRHRNSLTTRPYRYGYATGTDPAANEWPIYKHDLQTGDRWTFHPGPGHTSGEPVFIPRHNSTAEDDGWLVTYVYNSGDASSEFVVIDAQDFERGYVARVRLPQRVPYGFHGNWISDLDVAPPN